ncbi:Isopentenyl-diphosphate Delta-isomerase I [Trichostrongylus colubriformis]|uniref:isopentenyl-diphosphate Delta-isomerase n=1 Tax=Trichostrongylus colubriformis TaxID=6319 RepID=A0AAN8FZN9_TRICO
MYTIARRLLSLSSRSLQGKEALLESYNPVQVGYLSEQCIAVDEDDNVVGKVAKGAAHRVDTLGLHRAFSLFAFTPEKKLILQKRSAEKITFPLLWANTCCSHPLFTETELNGGPGAVAAAVRKVEHELGVVDLRPQECRVMGRFLYKAVMNDSLWGEHELDYVVLTRDLSLSRVTLNPAEVSDVRTVDEQELAEWVKAEPSSFSPWFLLFYRLRYLSDWWSKLDHIESCPVDMNIVRMN